MDRKSRIAGDWVIVNPSFEDVSTFRVGTLPFGLMDRYAADDCSDLEKSMV